MTGPLTRWASPSVELEPATAAAMASIVAGIEPDPLFGRRLRTAALNRYVAVREGMAVQPTPPVRAGAVGRLGRASLIASVLLAGGTASAIGASQEALPGDPLYGVKLGIEAARLEILPSGFRDDLYAAALNERLEEMARLIEAGRQDLAMSLTPEIEVLYAEFVEASGGKVAAVTGQEHRLVVLTALLERLPEQARDAVERAMHVPRSQISREPEPGPYRPTIMVPIDRAPLPNKPESGGAVAGPSQTPDERPEPTPRPTPAPRPTRAPVATPTATPIEATDEGGDSQGGDADADVDDGDVEVRGGDSGRANQAGD